MKTLDFSKVENVGQFMDHYLKIIKDIVKLHDRVVEKHPDDIIVDLKKDSGFTGIIISRCFNGFEPFDRMVNNACYKNDCDSVNIIDYLSRIIDTFDGEEARRLIEKYNEIYRFLTDNFNASVIFKECNHFITGSNNYLTSENVMNCVMKARGEVPNTVSFPEHVPSNIGMNEDELLEYIRTPLENENDDVEKAIKTNIALSIINGNSDTSGFIRPWKIYEAYRDEFYNWIREPADNIDKSKFPLIYGTDFNEFFISIYKDMLYAGDIDKVINDYRSSIDENDEKQDEEYRKSVNEQIEDIRKHKYFASDMFMECLSNERLVHEIMPIDLILYVLTTTPAKNCAAYQIHACFKALFMKAEYETIHMNPYYIHYTAKDEADSRDFFVARVLSLLVNFNNLTIEAQTPGYNEEVVEDSLYSCEVSYRSYISNKTKFLKYIKSIPMLKLEEVDSEKDPITAMNSSRNTAYNYDKEDLSIDDVDLLKMHDDILVKLNENLDTESKREMPKRENEIDELCDSVENRCYPFKHAIDQVSESRKQLVEAMSRYENIEKQFDVLKENIRNLKFSGMSSDTDDYNNDNGINYSISKAYDFEENELGNLIWPKRILTYVSCVEKEYDPDEVNLDQTRRDEIIGIKPGQLFKKIPHSSHKDGCH